MLGKEWEIGGAIEGLWKIAVSEPRGGERVAWPEEDTMAGGVACALGG
jgi:hypothetical protein